MDLSAVKTQRKTGAECFFTDNTELSINLLSFWQWSGSELLDNTLRGVLAEFIVASKLNCIQSTRQEWDAYDLITEDGIKVEVKSSAYLQSWQQKQFSSISFGVRPTRGWDAKTNVTSEAQKRHSDVYVFSLLKHKDKSTVNPLNLSQWTFYVVPTLKLDKELKPMQKNISLSKLTQLSPTEVSYETLDEAIKESMQ